jgi:glutamine cyclotransferase
MIEEDGKEYIWANLYQQNWIVKIDATTGTVVKRINLRLLEDIAILTPSEIYPKMTNYGK